MLKKAVVRMSRLARDPFELFILSLSRSYAGGGRVNKEDKLNRRANEMLDLIFLALVLVFFGIAFWYVRFCERV